MSLNEDTYLDFDLNDYGSKLYQKNFFDHRDDKLHPLKNIRKFKYYQIKQQMSNSIMLKLALDHAEKPFSISKIREIDDYFRFGFILSLESIPIHAYP